MNRQSGQTAIMMALSLTVLFGLVGFSVDVGTSYYTKQKAQAAAESAATAAGAYAKANGIVCGTNGITCNSTLTSCSSIASGVLYAGCQYAHQNGFPMSAISMAANLSTTTAPPCNPCTTPGYWIQARVSTTYNNLFMEVAESATANINAQAFAGVTGSTGGTGGSGSGSVPTTCVWVLDPTDTQSLLVSSGGISLSGCTAQVNSSANQSGAVNGWQPTNEAANANGSSVLTPASAYKVVGGASYNQNYCPSGGPFTCGAASVADPLSTLPALDETTQFGTTSCTQTSQYSPTGGTAGSPIVIPAGIYCGGINLSSGFYRFQTGGVFEMRGNSNLSISGGTTTGTNVMFYFTATTPSTSTANPTFSINTSNVTFSAPSTGTYKGILFFANPTSKKVAQSGNPYSQFAAGSTPNITGTIYLPTGYLLFTGGSGSNNGHIAIITYGLQINGSSSFTWDSTGTYTGLATYGASGGTTTYTSNLIQ
jgi:hypothetical protein